MSHNPVSKRLGTRQQGLQQYASKTAGGNLRNSASLKLRTVNLSYWSSVSVLRSRSFRYHATFSKSTVLGSLDLFDVFFQCRSQEVQGYFNLDHTMANIFSFRVIQNTLHDQAQILLPDFEIDAMCSEHFNSVFTATSKYGV